MRALVGWLMVLGMGVGACGGDDEPGARDARAEDARAEAATMDAAGDARVGDATSPDDGRVPDDARRDADTGGDGGPEGDAEVVACGDIEQPCCVGRRCLTDLYCGPDELCLSEEGCGAESEPCCAGDVCDAPLACSVGSAAPRRDAEETASGAARAASRAMPGSSARAIGAPCR